MDLDGRAPDDPSHHVIEPGLAGVVVGDVLQVAHERAEAQPATGRRATEPDPAPATGTRPTAGTGTRSMTAETIQQSVLCRITG